MAKQKQILKHLEVKYVKALDYKCDLVTGAFGSATINGLLNINFFVDKVPLPAKGQINLSTEIGGPHTESHDQNKVGQVEREIQFGMLMDVNSARNFHDWFGKKINELELALETRAKVKTETE